MVRIFLTLALFAVLLLGANLVVGLSVGDYAGEAGKWKEAWRRFKEAQETQGRNHPNSQALLQEAEALRTGLAPMQRRATIHMWVGIGAVLAAVLVNCITVTYFVGTSRWCREVCDAYQLDPAYAEESRRLKRRAFPFALLSSLALIVLAALGAASDPSAGKTDAAAWVSWHYLAALATLPLVIASFLVQGGAIGANFETIARILDEVRRIRRSKGLDPPADPSGDLAKQSSA